MTVANRENDDLCLTECAHCGDDTLREVDDDRHPDEDVVECVSCLAPYRKGWLDLDKVTIEQ